MKTLVVIGFILLLITCATPSPQQQAGADGKVMRRLAWMEGDFQTNYEPDRQVAEEHIKDWDGKVPDQSDVDSYLDYLSVLDSGRASEAEAKIKSFLAGHPKETRAVFILGVHYLRIKKKDLANYFFSQLEKDESFRWKSLLYNNLGMLALEDRNRVLALSYLDKATQSGPPSAAPYVNLGALYLQSRSYADAEKLFARAYDIDSGFEDAALGLGSALEGEGKFEEAHKIYSQFIEANPNSLSVVYNDAVLLGNRLKQREQAAQQMLQYIQRGGKESAKAQEIVRSWR